MVVASYEVERERAGLWSAIMRLIATVATLSLQSMLVLGVSAPPPTVSAAESESQIDVAQAGPLGAITVIGDSVLVGATIAPTLPTILAEQGWGPIRFRAGLGYSAGNYQPADSTFSSANWIRWWRAAGWDAPNVAVNLGNNDIGFCERGGVAECAVSIRYLLDVIGPDHTVWWSKITRPFDGVAYNQALDLVASERSNLRLWDWPAAQQANAVALGPDHIHLRDGPAYRTRSVLMAADITGQLAVGERTGTDAPLPIASGDPVEYQPLPPVRVLDTRTTATRLSAGQERVVDLSTFVPAGTRAVAVNLTSVDPATDGFLTGYACGVQRPGVSSANYTARTNRGAQAVLPVSPDRTLCVFTSASADLIVDIQGAFVPDATRFSPVTPQRLLDTRHSGRSSVMTVAAPPGADAVALNLTVTGSGAAGYLTAYPCGDTMPVVSNVNFGVGETIAGAAYVPIGAGGTVCLFTNTPVDVVVDLTGTFSADGALHFTPAVPTRVYDTRDGVGGWTPIHGGGQTIDVRVAPAEAVAVTGTLTIVTPSRDGFLTAYGCGAVPPTSNVNAPRAGVLANAVTVVLAGDGRLCIRALAATHVVFDTTGWWA
jgi:hypothetical protein